MQITEVNAELKKLLHLNIKKIRERIKTVLLPLILEANKKKKNWTVPIKHITMQKDDNEAMQDKKDFIKTCRAA